MAIAIWFIPNALGFDLGSYELAYSLVLTPIGFYFAIRLDEGLEDVKFRPALNAMIWLAFTAALITYTGFSFHVPTNFFIVAE
jgi:Sec-independent protein secretion pathway component TatC